MIDNILNPSNILAIVAHPDDEILGLGATIKKLTDRGIKANAVILGEGLTSRQNNREDTDKLSLIKLKNDTNNAIQKVGYSNVEFCDFPDNRFDSLNLLDIIKIISNYVDKYRPDTILTHHFGDLNIDHRITFNAVITACRPVGDYNVKNILCFETPSSTEWSFIKNSTIFHPNIFVDVTDTLESKLEAMDCYETEIRTFPHPRSNDALKIIANRWGTVVGVKAAEAFELVRSIIRE